MNASRRMVRAFYLFPYFLLVITRDKDLADLVLHDFQCGGPANASLRVMRGAARLLLRSFKERCLWPPPSTSAWRPAGRIVLRYSLSCLSRRRPYVRACSISGRVSCRAATLR